MKIWKLLLVSMIFVSLFSISVHADDYIPGQMIVKYKENENPIISSILGIQESKKPDITIINVDKQVDIEKLAALYETNPDVEYAEPNYLAKTFLNPNDPSYSSQYHHTNIESALAWNITTGNTTIIIGIIDTGVDWDHPDLAANIWNNTGETNCIDGIDDDNNTYIDDCRGWDFVDNISDCYAGEDCDDRDNNPMDFHGHGTHVSGIAAAVTNNSLGISGVCWNCKIMPLRAGFKYSDGNGYLSTTDIVSAIYYGTDNGADIISMSFGLTSSSSTIQNAINYAYSKGVVLIAASGNSNSATKQYPAAYDNVIAISSTDSNDAKSFFSNHGTWIDNSISGTSIYSTYFNDTYATVSGTSMATPMAAGVIGLILSHNSFTHDQIKTILHSAVDNLTSSVYMGTGRINAYKALQINQSPILILNSSLDDNITTHNLIITGTANLSFSNYNFSNYTLEYGTGLYPSTWNTITSGNTSVINGSLGEWAIGSLSNGTYTLRLIVRTNQIIWKNSTANETLIFIDETIITSSNINTSIDSPIDNIIAGTSQTFNCSARSNNTLTNITLYIWNSSAAQTTVMNIGGTSNSSSIVYNFTTSDNYTWNCLAQDGLRQAFAPFNKSIEIDATKPEISFIDPSDNNSLIIHRNYTFINMTASDTANISSCILQWTNLTASTNTSMNMSGSGQSVLCYYNYTDLLDGRYNYTIVIADSLNNFENMSRNIIIDTTDLNITNISTIIIADTIAIISLNASEPINSTINYGLESDNLNLTINDSSFGTSKNLSLSDLTQNTTYFYYANACDYTGNCTNTTIYNFTTFYDATSPNITFIYPTENNSVTLPINYTFINVSVSDSSNISACKLEWNGTNISMTMSAIGNNIYCYYNMSNLSDGNYSYKAFANDSLNNIGNSSLRSILIDKTAPNITLISPNTTNETNSSIIFLFTTADLSPNLGCILYINGTATETNTTIYNDINSTFNSSLPEGSYSWYISCNDTVNNIGNSSILNFIVNLAPEIIITFPTSPVYKKSNDTITVNYIYNETFPVNITISLLNSSGAIKTTVNITNMTSGINQNRSDN
ncbi:MAG: S8 family peptidase, partial [Candidatus Aenigmatarchaeota archaeon]